ncbi:MAG TPA: TlpA disulfide reductase family protein [Actinomycetes bacterium]|nr:TlpA disulfide reductase family protein [Actinomycetes bacterium]
MNLGCWASRLAVLLVLLATALTGCAAQDEGAGERVTPSPSTAAAVPTSGAGSVSAIQPCPASGEPVGRGDGVPELELPCLGAGGPVQMAGLTERPRLVNIWASWCEPCRDEMPWLQQAHDTGEVDVLGVDAEDQVPAAAALLDELGVTFPSVFDPRNEFAREVRVITKPTTLFVSEEGEVVFVLPGAFASYDELGDLVKTHLKVDLS